VLRTGSHAHRHADRPLSGRGDLARHRRGEPLGEHSCLPRVLPGREHAELVAAEPGDHVNRADCAAHRHRDVHEDAVARVVPVSVVDPLEAVDVEQEQCERVPVAPVELHEPRQRML
jgi:hypothetical protein